MDLRLEVKEVQAAKYQHLSLIHICGTAPSPRAASVSKCRQWRPTKPGFHIVSSYEKRTVLESLYSSIKQILHPGVQFYNSGIFKLQRF